MIERVDEMPWEGEYPTRVTALMLANLRETLGYTKAFYEVRNPAGELVLGAGVALWSFARPPELWIMLAKPYFLNVRESLRLSIEAMEYPIMDFPGLVADVACDSPMELHFVKHHGWEPTGKRSLRPDGEAYIQFGVK